MTLSSALLLISVTNIIITTTSTTTTIMPLSYYHRYAIILRISCRPHHFLPFLESTLFSTHWMMRKSAAVTKPANMTSHASSSAPRSSTVTVTTVNSHPPGTNPVHRLDRRQPQRALAPHILQYARLLSMIHVARALSFPSP